MQTVLKTEIMTRKHKQVPFVKDMRRDNIVVQVVVKSISMFICQTVWVAADLYHNLHYSPCIDMFLSGKRLNRCQWLHSGVHKTIQIIGNKAQFAGCIIFHHGGKNKCFSGLNEGLQFKKWEQLRQGNGYKNCKSIRFKIYYQHIYCHRTHTSFLMSRCEERTIIIRKSVGVNKKSLCLMIFFKATKNETLRLRDSHLFSLKVLNKENIFKILVFTYLLVIYFKNFYSWSIFKSLILLQAKRSKYFLVKTGLIAKDMRLLWKVLNYENNLDTWGKKDYDIKSKLKSQLLKQATKQKKNLLSKLDHPDIKNKDDIALFFLEKYKYDDLLIGNNFQPAPQSLYVYPASHVPGIANNLEIPLNKLFVESHRLQTFLKFPRTSEVSPIILANEGFIYDPETGSEDKVKCIFCKKSHKAWQYKDNVNEIHRNISKDCPMAWGKDCRNIPIQVSNQNLVSVNGLDLMQTIAQGGEQLNSSLLLEQLLTGNGSLRTTAAPTTLTTPSTVDSSSGRSTRESTQSRLDSRGNRPQSSTQATSRSTRTVPLEFDIFEVTQGSRNIEIVECFYCGGQHSISENGSNFWIEHASLFPDCGYVRLRRGKNFVEAVLELLPNNNEITEAMVNEQMNLPIALGASASAPSRHQSSLENFRPQENLTDLMEEHVRLNWRITCQKCLVNKIEVVMIPCQCLVTCVECSITLTHCYKCNREVEALARAFFS